MRIAYKRRQFESNINKTVEETIKRAQEISDNLQGANEEHWKKVDKIYNYIFVVEEPQEEKIEFYINGFVSVTNHEQITEDFVFTYYDLTGRFIGFKILQ